MKITHSKLLFITTCFTSALLGLFFTSYNAQVGAVAGTLNVTGTTGTFLTPGGTWASDGKVGIGTTEPTDKLNIVTTTAYGGLTLESTLASSYQTALNFKHPNGTTYGRVGFDQNTDSMRLMNLSTWTGAGADILFYTNNNTTTPKMAISRDGNIRVNSGDSSYTYYGPNSSWGAYLYVGATPGKATTNTAAVIATDGNLHLDAGTNKDMYLNYYSAGRPIHVYGAMDSGYSISTTNLLGSINGTAVGNYNRGTSISSGDTNYDTGTLGKDLYNIDTVFNLDRAGFIDVWGAGGTYPPSTSHVQGFQAMHHINGHGMQLVSQYNQDTLWVRGLDPSTPRGWRKIIDSGNIGSQSVSYAASAGSAGILTGSAHTNGGDGWFRSNGGTGWYNESYGGGMYMIDSTYVRTYNSKPIAAQYFADQDSLGYYLNPASGSVLNSITIPVYCGGSCGIIYFGDTNASINRQGNNLLVGTYWTYIGMGVNDFFGSHSYRLASDSRLKKNIKEISNSMEILNGLKGVTFDWRYDEEQFKNNKLPHDKNDVGLIAQDVEKVLPQAVGTDPTNGYKNVAYSKVIPVLVEVAKEQQTQIVSLKSVMTDFITQFKEGLIETKKLIVDGVDILKKLNELGDKSDKQQQTIDSQQQQIDELRELIK